MTNEERKHLKAMIVTTSLYYGRELPDVVVRMQVEDLDDLPFQLVCDAFGKYRKNPANRVAPIPAAIRALIEPESSDEDNARVVASRIVEALGRFGWTNEDRAKEFIGELGWLVVKSEGGWQAICQRVTHDEVNTFKAQARELAKALMIRSKSGTLDQAPRLPGQTNKQVSGPTSLSAIVPQLTKQEKKDG